MENTNYTLDHSLDFAFADDSEFEELKNNGDQCDLAEKDDITLNTLTQELTIQQNYSGFWSK